MSDWAANMAEKLKRKEDEQRDKEKLYTLQRQQIQAEAPYIWESLKQTLHSAVTKFNKLRPETLKMDADYEGAQEVTLESEQMIVKLSFDKAASRINYAVGGRHTPHKSPGQYYFTVRGGNVIVGGENDHGADLSGVQSVAEAILNQLIW